MIVGDSARDDVRIETLFSCSYTVISKFTSEVQNENKEASLSECLDFELAMFGIILLSGDLCLILF